MNHAAVGVAQLVERRSVAPNVAGSIPVSHPNLSQLKTKSFMILPCSFERQNIAQSLHNGSRDPPYLGTGQKHSVSRFSRFFRELENLVVSVGSVIKLTEFL
jgi:hypothetical protein